MVVDCPSTGIKQTFPCNKWLATDEDDKRIERRLTEDLSLRETRRPSRFTHAHTLDRRSLSVAVPWYIWVYTSNMKGAGTDAQVHLVLYGRDGKSDDIKLQSKSNAFEAGACDEFKEDVVDVGIPFKLRVSHDNKKAFAAWHLDRVRRNKREIVGLASPV